MSRAERFEDEKRRIIESCFSKLDTGGQLAESYITHIRIQEDAMYPSMPPPPESPADNRKPRVIIIAVRSTGRVRMHKARENNNGSFSIGKTWSMEELSAIESYSNCPTPPATEREAQHRQWAGSVGFTVTITKPYYWQAGTRQEKDFFIASAVKIFRKYTNGQTPELRGFDARETAMIMGAGLAGPAAVPAAAGPAPAPPQPPFASRDQSRDESRYRSPGPPPGSGPNSRRPSESPARFPTMQAQAGSAESRPPPPSEQTLRMMSQENLNPQAQYRPGTARGPSGPTQQETPPMSRSPRMQDSSDLSPPPRRDRMAPIAAVRPPSPLRQRGPGRPPEGVASSDRIMNRGPPLSTPGSSTMPRETDGYRGRQANTQAQPVVSNNAPQLPALGIHASQNASSQQLSEPTPNTASTLSPGVDLGDAAAIGALTSFWNQDATQANANRANNADDAMSPPTPERSKRRPMNGSTSTLDLRPAPLVQARKNTEELPGRPRAVPEAVNVPAVAAARTEQSSVDPRPPAQSEEIKPLKVQKTVDTSPPRADLAASRPPTANGTSTTTVASAQTPSMASTQPSSTSSTPAQETPPALSSTQEEPFRPGLGPMIRKQAVAERFKKAANAANAFKPRPGGAAEKILKQKAEREGGAAAEPDGITGVVPRPVAKVETPPAAIATPTEEYVNKEIALPTPPPAVEVVPMTPAVETLPPVIPPRGIELVDDAKHLQPPSSQSDQPAEREAQTAEEKIEQRQQRQPQVKVKRRSAYQERNIAALEIDRKLLDGRGIDFDVMLSDFGWSHNILRPQQLADFERDIRRELGRVEAGSWLSHSDTGREERVNQVEALLNKAIEECDELEGLLTLYSVELSSLNDDIAFIEAQSQGLQVQSANQKLLQSELQGLVDTMSLDRRTLEPLQHADLSDLTALVEIESSLVRLYQAMLTMDPSLQSSVPGRPGSRSAYGENETANMVALREKKSVYERESTKFSQRLLECLETKFTVAFSAARPQVLRPVTRGSLPTFNNSAFADVRGGLWIYNPLILFVKELNQPIWLKILQVYQSRAKQLYTEAFREDIASWKRTARASSGEEAELLFTHQEKEDPASGGSITSTARRITVKRSQTLAKTFRSAAGEKGAASGSDLKQIGSSIRASAFAGALDEMAPLISREQNFVVDFFHATSLEMEDFTDLVRASLPAKRLCPNLMERKPVDPNRAMADIVTGMVNDVFATFANELSAMLDWAVSEDPLQGVGVMACLGKHAFYLQDSNQDYLTQLTGNLFTRLRTRFGKFVEEQIRAIEDTKVKIKKRKGVISFMKTFPHFSAAVENIFHSVSSKDYESMHPSVLEVRTLIDEAYDRINRAMFDSLKAIATENPATAMPLPPGQVRNTGDDAEDKEKLNYHVLLIENMNHYVEEVDEGSREGVLSHWKARALMERAEALDGYVGRVIRRPLGKLLEFLESVESIQASQPGNPSAAAARPSYNRKAFRHLLALHDSKEIRRGIDTLRKRIEKHFGEGDEEAISRSLITLVCKECERSYERTLDRVEKLIREAYPPTEGEKSVEVDFTRAEIQAGFRR